MSEPGNIRTKSYGDLSEQLSRIWRAAGGKNMSSANARRYERAMRTMRNYRQNIENTSSWARTEREMDNILSRGYNNLSDEERDRLNALYDANWQRGYSRSVYAKKNNRR